MAFNLKLCFIMFHTSCSRAVSSQILTLQTDIVDSRICRSVKEKGKHKEVSASTFGL